jgi:integrase
MRLPTTTALPRNHIALTTTTTTPPPHFRASDGSAPTVADLKGSDVCSLRLAQKRPPHIPLLAWEAIVPFTRSLHRIWLVHLKDCPKDLPLTLSILEMIRVRGMTKTWQWSTILKYMLTIDAALKALPMYSLEDRPPIILTQCPIWKAALKSVRYRANTTPTREPTPATAADIERTCELETDSTIRLFIRLTWLLAARVGDTRSLRRENISSGKNGTTSITFMEGKGSHFRGPYTVHINLPKETQEHLDAHIQALAPRGHLFKKPHLRATLIALRRANGALEAKSLRRGALQTMAKAGIKEDTLKEFSGHTNNTTLVDV